MKSFGAQVTTVAIQLHSVRTVTTRALVRRSVGAISGYVTPKRRLGQQSNVLGGAPPWID